MNFAEMDVTWYPIFFGKCSIWLPHDKKLEMFPNPEYNIFIFTLVDFKRALSTLYSIPKTQYPSFLLPPNEFWMLQLTFSNLITHPPQIFRSITMFWQLSRRSGSEEHIQALFVNANVLNTTVTLLQKTHTTPLTTENSVLNNLCLPTTSPISFVPGAKSTPCYPTLPTLPSSLWKKTWHFRTNDKYPFRCKK